MTATSGAEIGEEFRREFERAIRAYDSPAATEVVRSAMAGGVDPSEGFDVIAAVMDDIGRKFEGGEMWLPDMVGAAEAVQATMPLLQERARSSGGRKRTLGTAVMGTVKGDIHNIGIQTVCSLMIGAGFDVQYLGIDVPPERFVAAVRETGAELLGLSALLTTTATEARAVLDLLAAEGLRDGVRVMLGGGAITEDFALRIGADAYGASAVQAVSIAKRLMDLGEEVTL